jgi:hypothetical protein
MRPQIGDPDIRDQPRKRRERTRAGGSAPSIRKMRKAFISSVAGGWWPLLSVLAWKADFRLPGTAHRLSIPLTKIRRNGSGVPPRLLATRAMTNSRSDKRIEITNRGAADLSIARAKSRRRCVRRGGRPCAPGAKYAAKLVAARQNEFAEAVRVLPFSASMSLFERDDQFLADTRDGHAGGTGQIGAQHETVRFGCGRALHRVAASAQANPRHAEHRIQFVYVAVRSHAQIGFADAAAVHERSVRPGRQTLVYTRVMRIFSL